VDDRLADPDAACHAADEAKAMLATPCPTHWRFLSPGLHAAANNSSIIEFMDKDLAVQALAALAHPVRLDAFRALVVAGHDGLAQKDLAEAVGVGPTNLAFHLKELTAAGLVVPAQAGRYVMYRAAYDRMNDLLAHLTESCCAGSGAAQSDAATSCVHPSTE